MVKDLDIKQLLTKAEELRVLFVLGQRVIPFLEEIFIFVNEIKPLLDEINLSIQDNLNKMPKASKQLSKVTEANEMATTEIMDIVDGLIYKAEIISSNVEKLNGINNESVNNPSNLLNIISNAVKDIENQNVAGELKTEINNYKQNQESDFQTTVRKTNDIISSIKDDSNSIMISLQVQDITAQQIAAVNNLLETVQGKLSQILEKFSKSDIGGLVATTAEKSQNNGNGKTNVSKLHRDIAFDPDAVDAIMNKESRQDNVDALIEAFDPSADYSATIEGTPAVEEEIPMPAPVANIGSDLDDELLEPVDIDDIDALFASNNIINSEPAQETPAAEEEDDDVDFSDFSQDDIDALFGK